MNHRFLHRGWLTVCLAFAAGSLSAQNMPIIQTKYTADPAPMVYNDTVFLYTTHDEDTADGFEMYDWLLYTSTDMVNWTDHGVVASTKDFAWRSRDNGAWALHVVARNGKFYMYCPLHGHGIGVLEAPTPYGPFKDPIGKPLVWDKTNWYDIDPAVWIDDDGQAYMYWGNPYTYYARLNDDMVSLKDSVVRLPYHIEHYQEGPWFYKRGGRYYLAYASTCCPEGIGYAMSDSPTGPWTSKGHIMKPTERSRGNHPGVIDYKGRSYVFGLNYDIMHLETMEHHERRSVSVAEMTYNEDGTIQEVPYWLDQKPLEQLEYFNPYRRVEAETMNWGYGLKTEKHSSGHGMVVTNVDDGEYIKLRGVDFGKKGARRFIASIASETNVTVELRLDSEQAKPIATLRVEPTGSSDIYRETDCKVKNAKGVHDLYLCFKTPTGKGTVKFDYWKFE